MAPSSTTDAKKRSGAKEHEVHGEWILHKLHERRGGYHARVRHRVTGKTRYFATRETQEKKAKNKVIAWIKKLEAEAAARDARKASPTLRTFSVAFEEWLSTRDCRPVTVRAYWQDYQGFAPEEGEKTKRGTLRKAEGVYKPFFGGMVLSEITVVDMQRFVKKMREEGASRRTRAKHIGCLRSFFEWCIEMEYLDRTPARLRVVKIGKGTKKKNHALTHEQARALLAACREKTILSVKDGARNGTTERSTWDQEVGPPKYLETAVLLALHTGLRRKNVIGLEWRHVDLGAGKITIPGEEMKAGNEHEMPIHPELLQVMRGLLRRKRKVRPRGRVIGERLTGISTSLESAWRRADLPQLGAWHTLRHTFRTWIDSRALSAVCRDLMGHAPVDVDDRYVHPPWADRLAAIEALPWLLGEKVEASKAAK